MDVAISWQYPMALEIAGARIHLHGLLEAIGIFIAFRYYLWLRPRSSDVISSGHRIWIIIGATLGAVLGARLIGALENVPQWIAAPDKLSYFLNNKTLVGGLLGGLVGVEGLKKIIGEKQRSGDLFVFPLMLGMLIGRAGCFSAGIYEQTYGLPTRLPWALDLGDGIMRHPVVVYEMLFLLLLMTGLRLLRREASLENGATFKVFMISYLIFRFALDFIKPGWRPLWGLGTIQLSCLAGILYYSRYLIKPRLLLAPLNLSDAR